MVKPTEISDSLSSLDPSLRFLAPPAAAQLMAESDLLDRAMAAQLALGKLGGRGEHLANPHLLIRPFIRREAVLSSQIEGTQADHRDLALFDASPGAVETFDAREVHNYVAALDYGLAREHEIGITLRLIREMHRILMTGVRGEASDPGAFRKVQNWIGPAGCSVDEATYVPPAPPAMREALRAVEASWHRPAPGLPAIVRIAIAHYQFEAIHPFLDGNGRVGRLLIAVMLCVERLLPAPLLYLSAYFKKHQQTYYARLLGVTQQGAWAAWVAFFLEGVAEQAEDAIGRARALTRVREHYADALQRARSSALSIRLLDHLFEKPAVTAKQVAEVLGVTPATAYQRVRQFLEIGLLEEVTGRSRGQVFLARPVVEASEADVRSEP